MGIVKEIVRFILGMLAPFIVIVTGGAMAGIGVVYDRQWLAIGGVVVIVVVLVWLIRDWVT